MLCPCHAKGNYFAGVTSIQCCSHPAAAACHRFRAIAVCCGTGMGRRGGGGGREGPLPPNSDLARCEQSRGTRRAGGRCVVATAHLPNGDFVAEQVGPGDNGVPVKTQPLWRVIPQLRIPGTIPGGYPDPLTGGFLTAAVMWITLWIITVWSTIHYPLSEFHSVITV